MNTSLSLKVLRRILEKVAKIESKDYSFDDIRSLFSDMRDCLELINYPKTDFLYDILQFFAHPNLRNQGVVFKYAHDYSIQYVNVFKHGGSTESPNTFDLSLVNSLSEKLAILQIHHSPKKLHEESNTISKYIYDFISDTPLLINHSDIQSCKLDYDENLKLLMLTVKTNPWHVTNTANNFTSKNDGMTIRFRLI